MPYTITAIIAAAEAAAAAAEAAARAAKQARRAFLRLAVKRAWADVQRDGYAVVPGVLSAEQVEELNGMVVDWYESVPGLKWFHAKKSAHGILKYHKAGHAPHMWQMRVWVKDFWEELWGGPVTTGFDGFCYIPKGCCRKHRCWAHVDQRANHRGLRCLQGLVALTTNERRTLMVWPGSHRFFSDQADTLTSARERSKTFRRIPQNYLDHIEQKHGIAPRAVKIPAGAIALWDGRTIHCNTYGPPGCREQRLVLYSCMSPRGAKANTDAQRRKRKRYLDDERTTGHNPYPMLVNTRQPQTYGDKRFKIDYDALPAHKHTVTRAQMLELIQ